MNARLYIGNLSPETTPEDLNSLFGQVARVISVEIVTRPVTGRSRGFGFVEVEAVNVEDVISKLGITDVDGRKLTVQRTPEESRAV